MSLKTRLWQHDTLWRIQDHRQITLSNGMVQDVWESRQDENGLVLFFETEELARAYLQSGREITNE